MPEPPENFDTPMGPVRRPPEIGSGREAWGCMVWGSPDNQIVLDFFGPEISVEAMDAPPERPRHEVVARIRLDPTRFLEVAEGFAVVARDMTEP